MENKILLFLKQYKWSLLLFIYISVISIYPIGLVPRPTFILGSLSVVLILYLISKIKYNKILLVLLSLVLVIEAVYAFEFSSSVGVDEISFIFETNAQEGKEMAGHYLVLIIIASILSFGLVSLSEKELKTKNISVKNVSVALLIFYLSLTIIIHHRIILSDGLSGTCAVYNLAPVTCSHNFLRSYSPSLYGTVLSVVLYANSKYEAYSYRNYPRQTTEGINISKSEHKKTIPHIYVVIGESATFNHMSLYGYDFQTTPFLDSMAHNTASIYYKKAYSGASHTSEAVPMILSASTGMSPDRYLREKHILDLSKEAGYTSYWISNQPRADILEMALNNVVNIASCADHTYFVEAGPHPEDLDLTGKFKSMCTDKNENYITFFHLTGSHMPYKYRSDENDILDKENIEGVNGTVDYDRSIHHTDRFLRELWCEIKNENAILIYTSDHGEIVGLGHGVGGPKPQYYQVPFVVMSSIGTDTLNTIADDYSDVDTNYISNTQIFYIALELMGYEVSDKLKAQATEDSKLLSSSRGVKKFKELLTDQ